MQQQRLIRCRPQRSTSSSPSHERSDRTDDSTHPGVGNREPLHRSIHCSVENEVTDTQGSSCRVASIPQDCSTHDSTYQTKHGRMERRNTPGDERSDTRTWCLSIDGGLENLIKTVGGSTGQEGSDCEIEQQRDAQRQRRKRETRCRGECHENC